MNKFDKIILLIFVILIVLNIVNGAVQIYELKEKITDNEKEYRYYDDIDFWNDMWAECEYGNGNYEAVRYEYGRYGD